PADLRGAALGSLLALDCLDPSTGAEMALSSIQTAGAAQLGDYLVGLLSLSREVLTTNDSVLQGLDRSLAGLDGHGFQVALPSLRLAFHRLPVRERAAFAEQVASLHGGGSGTELTRRLQVAADDVARARKVALAVEALRAELGFDD
ncbi:MAG: DUF5682 family protein, partial [Myxococcota bacterium]